MIAREIDLITPQKASTALPPINRQKLIERCLGDLDLMESLLSELAITGPRRVAEIAECAERQDYLETANAAHALKGASALLEAKSIYRLTSEIEDIGRSGTLEGVQEKIAELQMEMDRCVRFIPTIVQSVTDLTPNHLLGV
jgi:HPt (histidine-containing phosphotransfer) domain-containing protein